MSSFFDSPEFINQDEEIIATGTFPFAAIFNPPQGSKVFGLAVKLEQAALCGWDEQLGTEAGWQQVEWEHADGALSQVFITTAPRFTVLKRSPLQIKFMAEGDDPQYLKYDQQIYKQLKESPETKAKLWRVEVFSRSLIVPFSGFLPITCMPLALTTKGAVGAVFGKALTDHYKACVPVLQQLENSNKRIPLTAAIMSHIIIDGKFVKDMAGTPPETSTIAKLTIAPPTVDSFIIPEQHSATSQALLAWQKDYADVVKPYELSPEKQQAQLSGVEEEPVF